MEPNGQKKFVVSDSTKKSIGIAAGITSGVGFLWGMDPETVKTFFTETAQSQIAQAGFFFTMAAWLHAGRVKKEIARNFEALVSSINGVAHDLRKDLGTQREILANHATRLDNLEGKTKSNTGGNNA